jgi:hypothetical protein
MTEDVSENLSASKCYRGWIPTISGRLSFSVFGDCKHPTRAFSANVADDHTRYIAVHQFRDASDVLLPFKRKFSPLLFKIDGQLWFAFLAETEAKGDDPLYYLSGRAFLFPQKDALTKNAIEAIETFQEHLRNFRYQQFATKLVNYAQNEYQALKDFCTQNCSFYSDVKISRNGITEVYPPDPTSLPAHAPKLPAEGAARSHILGILATQLFFFVKDVGHRHQHHDPYTDQIVLLHASPSSDNSKWRDQTLYSIYRKVIEMKRDPHVATFNNSLGLVAYANAFSKIIEDDLKSKDSIPTYYSEQMVDSIKSTQARIERQFAIKQRRSDILRNTVIAVASLLFSFVGLLKLTDHTSKVKPDPILAMLLDWILQHPFASLVLLSLLITTLVLTLSMERSDVWSGYIRILRPLQFLPRRIVIGIVSLALALGVTSFYLFLP